MPRSLVVQRACGVVAAVLLAAGAVAVQHRPEPAPSAVGPDASSSPTSGATAPGGSAPAPEATGTAGPGTPTGTATSSAGAATTGPGLSQPGVYAVAEVASDGSLEVVERVRTASPVRELTLAAPRSTASGVAATRPTVSGFQAEAGGQVVTDTLPNPLPTGGDRLQLPVAATQITMRYRLDGSAGRSQPAPVGRVLVLLPPLTRAGALGALPVTVVVVGGTVRNLVCPDLPTAQQLCGRQDGTTWSTASLTLGRATVVAQLDLPQPGST